MTDPGGGGTTYSERTNADILLIENAEQGDTVPSTDDNIVYAFVGGKWYSTIGGEVLEDPGLIPVGEGFVWSDDSLQTSAGQQPVDGHRAFVSKGGLASNSGLTSELPKQTIMDALDILDIFAIEIADGIYDEQVEANDGSDLNGIGASILNTSDSATALKAANTQQNRLGFVGSFGSNSIIYEIDGIERNVLDVSTITLGSPFAPTPNVIGISIAGTNDDIQVKAISGNNNSIGGTLVDITGTSETAISIALGNFTNFADDFTGIDCKSSDPLQIVNVNFDNFENGNGVIPTGIVFCTGTSGIVTLRGANAIMPGEMFVSVKSGLSLDISMSNIQGNIECLSGGNLSFSKLGILLGNVDIQSWLLVNPTPQGPYAR